LARFKDAPERSLSYVRSELPRVAFYVRPEQLSPRADASSCRSARRRLHHGSTSMLPLQGARINSNAVKSLT